MLTNACKYAIRSILYLAIKTNEDCKISVKTIADELETPQPFLSKLLQQLTRNRLVSSTKGPNGGFYLSDENKQNTIWDIIEIIDGTSKFDECFLGLSKCEDENPCPVHFIVSPFKKRILVNFRDKTISQYVDDIKQSKKIISLKDFDILKK
ncbi:Rrf2 family transcriptional regulator [Flavivirga aquatica]|uniref:Rrf2 family transcriptional regulator n=1 Tax=Flavivirga aquatica TaxID=1849968 RepID=A0A1E5T8E3_9FLAO|nr:Rrf2 family transcriptional regulator [Flavivirga aquatica]OEK07652.1 Rrf2 family transcriptional regulator [Flavivirga aquatica]